VSNLRREFSFPRRVVGALSIGLIAGLPAVPAAADSTLTVSDAEVSADESSLSFEIRRSGDTTEGVRVLVETAAGGENPASPGTDYTPLPANTAVTLAPGETSATVEVDIAGAVEGAEKSLLLRLTAAHSVGAEPQLSSAGLNFPVNATYPAAMVVTDLDGDGDEDIVTGNDLSLSVSVLLGDGAGGFGAAVNYVIDDPAALLYAVSIAVGDVTGDSVPDVVAAGFNPALAYVFAGDGEGGLAVPKTVELAAADIASDVALADLNADGDLDLVAPIPLSNEVRVLFGDGVVGFGAPEVFPTGTGPAAVTVADLNGDGSLDIVTGNGGGGDASFLAGDGAGAFAAPVSIDLGADAQPVSIAAADVNGDGDADVVTANRIASSITAPGTVSIAAGDGAGEFAEPVQIQLAEGSADDPPGLLAVGDVTADGRADIVVSLAIGNAVVILAGEEEGGFADAARVAVAKGPLPVAIADVNGDDIQDILTGNALDDSVSILPGDAQGRVGFAGLVDAGQYPHAIAAADLDGDGHDDLATANAFSGDVSVLLGDGAGGLVKAGDFAVGPFPTGIAAADVDGDDAIDLITANGSGTVSLLLGDGAGGFSDPVDFAVGELENPYAVTTGDVDGDGALDIVTANTNIENDGMSVLLGDGAGGFGEPAVFEVGADPLNDPRSIALADVTGDGNLDAITANSLGSVAVLAGDGAGDFAEAVSHAAGLGPVVAAAADVTGDGHLDLVSLNHPGQTVAVLAGDGEGAFAEAVEFPIFAGPRDDCIYNVTLPCPWAWGMAVADADGDGDLDVATANTNTDTVSVLSNDGAGDFSALELFYTGAHPGSIAVADVTGDGNPDVVTANRENNNVAVLASELGRVEISDNEGLGIIPGGGPGDGDDGGCGCSTPASPSGAGGLLPIAIAVFFVFRRRRRAHDI
jgi:MYXO-CTERM domain-containing protein